MKQTIFPKACRSDLVVQTLAEEILIYDLKADRVFCLNETAAAVWQICDGGLDIAGIADQLQSKTNQLIPVELIDLTLENLANQNLLENYEPNSLRPSKTSRREMIRKIGLATAVALPVISSVVSPTAVHAASCPTGLVFCPASSPFGFPVPAGCYDVQNGYTVPSFPAGVECCTFCGALFAGTPSVPRHCVAGSCVPI